MVKGMIHSIESAGLVDGPGVRTVVFFQGCNIRCAYCHNPDTWSKAGAMEINSEELFNKIHRFKPYYQKTGGGVTFSGGEPLLQPEFLIEMLKLCREDGIHTAIDTAGFGTGIYEEILKYTDLIILDIKHIDNEGYLKITGQSKESFDEFLKCIQKLNVPLWIRHVVVPEITDSVQHIKKLAEIIKHINNVEKIELLPYHTLGREKYNKMGIPYKLDKVPPMDQEKIKYLENVLMEEIKNT